MKKGILLFFINVLFFSFFSFEKMDFESLIELKHWLYKYLDNTVAFHFHLTNIILLLMNDHREGEFYCFCNKIKKKDAHFVKGTMIFF